VTALTVQDTVNVSDFRVLDREWVLAQANAVLADSTVAAVKLGMLGSIEMVDTVAELLSAHPHLPLVCDPVLRAGGGGRLGKDEVGYAMRERLLPLSTIATPNLPEARILAELPEGTADECAEKLLPFCKHLLITGGHGDETKSTTACTAATASTTPGLASACPAAITVRAAPWPAPWPAAWPRASSWKAPCAPPWTTPGAPCVTPNNWARANSCRAACRWTSAPDTRPSDEATRSVRHHRQPAARRPFPVPRRGGAGRRRDPAAVPRQAATMPPAACAKPKGC
jgi:hypothetical protein